MKSNAAIGGTIVTNSTFGQASGGAVAVNEQSQQTVTVVDSKFLSNQATTPSVNEQYAQTGSNDGSLGGAIVNDGGSLVISSSKIVANQAVGADLGEGHGGGLYLAQSSVNTLENDTIVHNRATTSGDDIDNLNQ